MTNSGFVIVLLLSFSFVVEGVLDSASKTSILNAHNSARQGVSPAAATPIGSLPWSSNCETPAQTWANGCSFSHDPNLQDLGQGQNVFVTSSTDTVIPSSLAGWVNSWVNEKIYYDVTTNTCQSGKICGHYTQVVWAATTAV
jgi:pathogenesis-related protein 1